MNAIQPFAPEGATINLEHCGTPVTFKGSQVGWSGENEVSRLFFVCAGCGLQVAVEFTEHVGPPAGVQ